jgi:hypothetical protein
MRQPSLYALGRNEHAGNATRAESVVTSWKCIHAVIVSLHKHRVSLCHREGAGTCQITTSSNHLQIIFIKSHRMLKLILGISETKNIYYLLMMIGFQVTWILTRLLTQGLIRWTNNILKPFPRLLLMLHHHLRTINLLFRRLKTQVQHNPPTKFCFLASRTS